MKRLWIFLSLSLLMFAGTAFGAESHGVISVEDYYSGDSSQAYDFNFLTTRVRLDTTKLSNAGTLSLHFDGRERNALSSKDYNSAYIKNERLDTLDLEYTTVSKKVYFAGGRMSPKEFTAERVDGVNLIYQNETSGIGLFSGLKPDPYTQDFGSDYTAAGAYLFHRDSDLSANLAIVHNGYKGETDRQYIYSHAFYAPVREVNIFGTINADMNPDTDKVELTNAALELSYRPSYNESVSIGYNQFQAIQFYKSMLFDIARSTQQSYYLRGDYRLSGEYALYGRFNRQTQEYRYRESDTEPRNLDIIQIGLRGDNLLNSEIRMDISGEAGNGFSNSYTTYRADLRRLFGEKFELGLNGSYLRGRYEFYDDAEEVITYGGAGELYLTRRWHISLSYEGRQGRDYATNTLLSRATYRF